MFQDRIDAGQRLAAALSRYQDDPTALILAIPRGGVVVALPISLSLRLPLDVLITRKIGAPDNPELAVGAISETGSIHLNEELLPFFTSAAAYEEERRRQETEIARRRVIYRQGKHLPPLTDRSVILIDDGVATGATYLASVRALKAAGVAYLVAALPVAPLDTARSIASAVDECRILESPMSFYSVGEQYVDFRQVDDEEVVRCLARAWHGHGTGA